MDHLDQLENRSVHILREAYANFKNLGMLWSIGKDSTVLLWLARKAFFGHVPIPLIHIDTSFKIPEMIEYRDRLALEWNLTMIYGQNRAGAGGQADLSGRGRGPHRVLQGAQDRRAQAHAERRVAALPAQPQQEGLRAGPEHRGVHRGDRRRPGRRGREPLEGAVLLARATPSRAGTSATSLRNSGTSSRPSSRPAPTCGSIRCSTGPSSTSGSTSGGRTFRPCRCTTTTEDGKRYRSLGCYPCTHAVDSDAANVDDIILELQSGKFANIAERSGRAQDKADGGGLETLRRDGYM